MKNKLFKENSKKIIETCDLLCKNTFIFNHKWDMEVCKIPYTFSEEIIWNKIPFEDPEWTFMLNRHKFWVYLAKAYALTSEEKYFDTFISQVNSWIDTVDVFKDEYFNCSRTIEIGIRCLNWIKAIKIFKNSSCNLNFIENKMIESLLYQCELLIKTYDDFRTLSNWGVMQNCGLISLALNYQEQHSILSQYLTIALERLEYQCKIQILPDGVHWEQSPMYHNEVLNCLLDIAFDFEKLNLDTPSFILSSIRKLAYSNAYMKKPNHNQPMQGDSDETDLRDIITRSAYILKDQNLKYFGYNFVDFESIWDIGDSNISKYEELPTKKPNFTSIALKESGNFYLRDSFEDNSNYLWFRCGALGSGHGHGEHLHFDLVSNGEDFISDPGRFTYVEGNKDREFLKSCFAHNTTIVDNLPFSKFNGAWGIVESALTLNTHHSFNTTFDFVEGGHLGYVSLESPVVTNRKILYLKNDLWIIIDEFLTEGAHEYSQIFNFYPDKKPTVDGLKAFIKGENSNLFMYWIDKNLNLNLKNSIFSTEYNKINSNFQLVSSIKSNKSKTLFTIISSKELSIQEASILRGDGSFVPSYEAQAIEITLTPNNKIIVFNSMIDINNQKKSYLIDNILLYGKTGFIKKYNDTISFEIIKY
ncbi:alginate lyase family protein [Cetobacterium sp. 2G large]|uniref:alginate lyase family protein n=1 Tax=Cetobacterium sp. 2G large TaxID=2759680 RepID=UPI00163C65C5|nr:alginate lyase family protein [Cetobacterium sp. 2G large]MBC2853305.1 alginate lyase family protein [Cetobacterium sp. 2G large]